MTIKISEGWGGYEVQSTGEESRWLSGGFMARPACGCVLHIRMKADGNLDAYMAEVECHGCREAQEVFNRTHKPGPGIGGGQKDQFDIKGESLTRDHSFSIGSGDSILGGTGFGGAD